MISAHRVNAQPDLRRCGGMGPREAVALSFLACEHERQVLLVAVADEALAGASEQLGHLSARSPVVAIRLHLA